MISCWAVPHGFRLGVWFVPNDVRPEIPAILLKSKRQTPWNTEQVFRLQSRRGWRPIIHSTRCILPVSVAPCAIAACIAVTDVEPESPIFGEDSSHFTKHLDEMLKIVIDIRLSANLAQNAVISQSPVGRTRDACPKGAVGKR